MEKREDYIDWEQYFMGIALIAAQRSKDPSSQVGACIVSGDNIILSTGYNGAPKGFDDNIDMFWKREGPFLETKYAYVVHAELNAILNIYYKDLRGSRLYTTLFPCNECAKAIVQVGIKNIIYYDDKYNGTDIDIAAKRMLDGYGIVYQKYEEKGKTLMLKL